jgi:hypothetical protein
LIFGLNPLLPNNPEGACMRWINKFCLAATLLFGATAVSAQGITVLTALYGQSCGAAYADVTAQVKLRCDNQANCQYRIDTGTLGDPAFSCPKNFVALFACSGQAPVRLVQVAAEASGRTAVLSCAVPHGPAQPQ